jgi:hypothetical protein
MEGGKYRRGAARSRNGAARWAARAGSCAPAPGRAQRLERRGLRREVRLAVLLLFRRVVPLRPPLRDEAPRCALRDRLRPPLRPISE